MINYVENGDFIGFKNAVKKTTANKIKKHPKIKKSMADISKYKDIENLFKQINKRHSKGQ